MNGRNINKIKDNHLCSGCGTCNTLCPKQAITMTFDNIGQLLPQIDENKCIDCGICFDNCPSYDYKSLIPDYRDSEETLVGTIKNVYVGKATDNKIYENSQSGGVATAILYYLFDAKKIDAAIVCGVEYAKDYTSKAIVVSDKWDLLKYQKSSYTQVDMLTAIRNVSSYKSIAIIGTGCQIQGAWALRKSSDKYKNIKYLLGLICDRSLCRTVTDVLYGSHLNDKNKKIIWRDKSNSYKEPSLLIKSEDGECITLPTWERHVLKDPFTTPRCRLCFDKLNTEADIVLGDPWGMDNVDWKHGESLMLVRNNIGEEIIRQMIANNCIIVRDGSLEQVIKGQGIRERKDNILYTIAVYKHNGWLLPKYFDSVNTEFLDNKKLKIVQSLISEFISMSKKNKKNIVNRYSRNISLTKFKINLYTRLINIFK
jgi:coenzyme F420 hydrogenase subunit beta